MKLKRPSKAGTYESNDVYIMLFPVDDGIKIELESVVYELFGDTIKNVILTTLHENNIENVHVKAIDKGALDFTIKARVLTAIKRGLVNG